MRRRATHIVLAFCLAVVALVGLPRAAFASPQTARPARQKQIDRAIERGVEFLLGPGGLVTGLGRRTTLDQTPVALAVYALLVSGVDRDRRDIERAIERIARARHERTYGTATALLALAKHDPVAHEAAIRRLATKLQKFQAKGTWGYPAGDDLSNTQYALLGLWAAQRAGAEVDDRVWLRAATALSQYADAEGGFSYRRRGGSPTGSMTAAGLGSAAICRAMLRGAAQEARPSEALRRELDVLEARGLEWFADRFSATENPGQGGAWLLYYLYAVERVGALHRVDRFGEHEWYGRGALTVVASQSNDGSWRGPGGSVASTAFALLFLSRATERMTRVPESGPETADQRSLAALEKRHRRDLGRNRSHLAQPEANATSQARDHPPALACDGRLDTWWEAVLLDDEPRLTIDFGQPRSIDTILVGHPPAPSGTTLVETFCVLINGDESRTLAMPGDRVRKGRLRLAEPVLLERLELVVEKVVPPAGTPGAIGVGEVEIQIRSPRH